MTTSERVEAVADYGFTERQACFLVLVMRHAGLCVKRQYATFTSVANGGEKCNVFFEHLVRRGFAVAAECIHNRAQLYHVHSMMRLDAALMSPQSNWLTTRSEKLAYLQSRAASELARAVSEPSIPGSLHVAKQCPGTFPIGVDPDGHLVLLYLAAVPGTDDFRTFLIGHTELLGVTRDWTLRVLLPQPLRRAADAYQTVVSDELQNPLTAEAVYDLKRYFFHRRRGTDLAAIPEALRAFLRHCAEVFDGPRFTHLYRRWLTEQDSAFTPVSPVIQDAIAAGRGRVEFVLLSHSYDHLSPLVTARRVPRRKHPTGDEKGDEAPRTVNPSVNPAP
jgi:hypothetical protein